MADIPNLLYNKARAALFNRYGKKAAKNGVAPLEDGVFDKIEKPVSDHYTFGFGSKEIVPPHKIPGDKTYYVAGYRINNPAVGILDYMQAKALWIDDNSGRGAVVFVSVDCVGLFGYDINIIKSKLDRFLRKTGCRNINICSTHCHAGIDTMGMWGPLPKSGRDPEFMEVLYESVIAAVRAAYADKRDGKIYLGYAKAYENAQFAPRPPHVCSDVITRLRFSPDDGGDDIYLVNFASHPESLLGKNSMVSADFPCYMAKYIAKEKNAKTIFFVGAIGGIRMNNVDENNVLSTIKTGEMLGELVCSIENETELAPMINILRQEMYLTCDNPVFWFASKTGIIPEKMLVTGTGSMNVGMKTEMSYIQIGSLNMLLLPGELFPELAYGGYLAQEESSIDASPDINPKPLCEIANDENLLIFGLANHEVGYILTPNDYLLAESLPFINETKDKFGRNHYPETNSLGPETAYTVAETFEKMMKKVTS